MEIQRINSYDDARFAKNVLYQHGGFLIDGEPCEVEIVSDFEAIVRGENPHAYQKAIEEFRFYAPHITTFYDSHKSILLALPQTERLTVSLDNIQPSQFFVDEEKIAAIRTFIHKPEDIVLQLLPYNGRYISLDGHTRLYYAVMQGWDHIRGVIETSSDYIYAFAEEANRRGIFTPKDMTLVSHAEYEAKWNRFCEEFFAEK